MSTINIDQVKADLRLTHSSDDGLLQILIDASEDEALRFMNRTELPTLPQDYPPEYDSDSNLVPEEVPSSEDPIAASVYAAVFLLVRAKYDTATADEIGKLRVCAESLLQPYRVQIGV